MNVFLMSKCTLALCTVQRLSKRQICLRKRYGPQCSNPQALPLEFCQCMLLRRDVQSCGEGCVKNIPGCFFVSVASSPKHCITCHGLSLVGAAPRMQVVLGRLCAFNWLPLNQVAHLALRCDCIASSILLRMTYAHGCTYTAAHGDVCSSYKHQHCVSPSNRDGNYGLSIA